MHPEQLKKALTHGLLSFPLTDFDAANTFNPAAYQNRLEWLMPYGATVLFAAGGTGEFFSLTAQEFSTVTAKAVQVCSSSVPIVVGAGFGTATAISYAQEAERLGAQGILLMPHYLTEANQNGLVEHVSAVCKSTKLGVIVYNRGACRLNASSVALLADRHPNLIGLKDGLGDIELMVSIRRKVGDRLAYIGGLPTAEVFASAYKAIGVPTYSSAVFNFIPRTAMDFYHAMDKDDTKTVNHLIDTFFLPYLEIRNRCAGYAVSIVKAGATLVGHSAGHVRTPLTELNETETAQLKKLIEQLGPQ